MSLEGVKLTQQLDDAIQKEKLAIALSKQAFELRTDDGTSVEYATKENNEIFAKFLTSHETFIATLDELVKKFEQGFASILQDNAELRDAVKRLQEEKQLLRDTLKNANGHLNLMSTQLQQIEGLTQQLNKVNLDVCWHDII